MDKDILKDAKEDFKRAYDAESRQRKMSEECLRFGVLGEQWPEDVKRQREDEGRPCLTINRMPSFLKQVTNDARLNRPSIHVKPTGGGSAQATARIQTDLVRNIWAASSGDVCCDTALDFAAACGIGYMRVSVDYACDDNFDQDIILERVSNPFTIFGDPDSTSGTSDDWMSAFVSEFYSKAKFESRGWKWNDIKPASFETDDGSELWYDGKNVRVAERWKRTQVPTELVKLSDGKIMQADEVEKVKDLLAAQGIAIEGTRPSKTYKVKQYILTGQDVLEENDWLGRYIPIVPMYGEEWNVAGKRYFFGLFNRAMDPQRMFNYWRTASTELVALAPKAPFVGAVGAFATDGHKWATANNKSHAYLEYDPVLGEPPPARQAFAGVPAGALQEAMNASDDMKSVMGLFDASLGAKSNETSGKAIIARQREGDTSTFNFADNRNRCVAHVGRVIIDLIPQVYTVARVMRGIREDGTTYEVPVNQPVEVRQPQQPGGQEQYVPAPEYIEGVTQIFDLTVGKYDVTVDAGPSFTTRREETAEQMMEFIRVFPQSAPLIGDLLAKNLDWPGAEQVAERLRAMLPPQANGQINAVVQQLQQQLGQAGQEVQQLKMQAADKTIDARLKEEELRIKAFEAETERIKTIAEAEAREKDRQARVIEAASRPPVQPGVSVSGGTGEQRPSM